MISESSKQRYREAKPHIRDNAWRTRLFSYAYFASGKTWKPYKHVRYLSDRIEEAVHEHKGRLIIMMPPQVGKSLLTSVWLPIWYLDNYPTSRIIQASYSHEKTSEWTERNRDIFDANELIETPLGKTTKKDKWTTAEGGFVLGTSTTGQMTGWSGDLIIIDDPVKDLADAMSPTKRRKRREWYEGVVETRLQEDSSVITCMTRWHENDFGAFLLNRGEWDVVRLPALAEKDDPIGREPGETICEKRYSTEHYERLKDKTAEKIWTSVYMQEPQVSGGEIFKKHFFQNRWTELPSIDKWYQSWDFSMGSTSDDASYCAGTVWAVSEDKKFMVDSYHKQIEYPEMKSVLKAYAERYPSDKILIENAAQGTTLLQDLDDEVDNLTEVPTDDSKKERAYLAVEQWKDDKVFIPEYNEDENSWVADFVGEMRAFPYGDWDDWVDSTSHFLKQFTTSNRVGTGWW